VRRLGTSWIHGRPASQASSATNPLTWQSPSLAMATILALTALVNQVVWSGSRHKRTTRLVQTSWRVRSFFPKKTNGQPLGVVGICYGSWLLAKASAMGDIDFCCAIGYHPSTRLEAFFGGDETAMLKDGIKMPTKFLTAGNDSDIYNNKDGMGKAALEKSGGGVVEFPDMLHGWVSRGDVADEKAKRDVQRAMDLTIEFFAVKMPKVETT
jgi:dienelactone hydrolase